MGSLQANPSVCQVDAQSDDKIHLAGISGGTLAEEYHRIYTQYLCSHFLISIACWVLLAIYLSAVPNTLA